MGAGYLLAPLFTDRKALAVVSAILKEKSRPMGFVSSGGPVQPV